MNFLPSFSWQEFLIYAPLGIIGAWRWSVWLWQKIIGWRYRPTPVLHNDGPWPSLSVVTPVYNENPDLFFRALSSWQYNGVDEIIAVIDATDTSCIEVFRTFSQKYPGARSIVTDIPGKRPALAIGARAAQGDIIALVDSDTVWGDNIRDILLAPFADPRVGGVSTRQAVLSPRTLAERLFAIRLNLRYLHEFPYLASVGNALTCLSGRTAVYRRSAILPLLDALVHEQFLDKPCISGDDKRLTSLLQAAGWQVRFQQNAAVYTTGMPRLLTFFKQNLRWGRNSWRTDIRMFFSRWIWQREPFLAYHLFDRAVQPFTLLLGPIYLGIALSLGHWLVATVLISWWIISRAVKIWPHLRIAPRDIFIVPFFALAQYVLAIIKIYALFTLDYQSWITRWHASRIKRLPFLELLPSRLATFCVIGGLAFSISQHEYTVNRALEARRAHAAAKNAIPYTQDFSAFALDQKLGEFQQARRDNYFGTYVTRPGDTPLLLTRKWNLSPAVTEMLFPQNLSDSPLPPGVKLSFPIESLRTPLETAKITTSSKEPLITYDALTNTIDIRNRESVVTLNQIATSLGLQGLPNLLIQTAPKNWLLESNLYVSEGVTLILDGQEVEWLKLKSNPGTFIRLRAYNAGVLIRNTKITSWDTEQNTPDTDPSNGRAYVIAQANGRMDVLDSEIAYLGYSRAVAIERNDRIGGVYGLSWKIPNDTIGRFLLTGVVQGNHIHDNYFGLYTFGASGMVIRDNEIYNNIQYGIDPHDDSINLLIADNFVHDNGNHGIIVSKRVNYSTIRDNRSVNNRLHGLMLDRESNYNVIENNFSSGNVNGLALYDSHHNLIRGNTFANNRYGIRANMLSSENRFDTNTIRGNEKGIFLYGNAANNIIVGNTLADNNQALALKETTRNVVINPIPSRANTLTVKLDDQARTGNFIQKFE